ncbi:MAG: oxidoreductase of aldo/keto reductase family, subgroup 1, partial [uncultured Quadrisphaera sp.]
EDSPTAVHPQRRRRVPGDRPGHLRDARQRGRRRDHRRAGGRLPPAGHLQRLPQRARGRRGPAPHHRPPLPGPGHHQAARAGPPLREGAAVDPGVPGASGRRPDRPVPDPLAQPAPEPLRRGLARRDRRPRGWRRGQHRGLQLRAAPPRGDHRRDRRRPGRRPGRDPPVLRLRAAAGVHRRPRDRHRVVEPARAGAGAARPGGHLGRRRARRHRGAGRAAVAPPDRLPPGPAVLGPAAAGREPRPGPRPLRGGGGTDQRPGPPGLPAVRPPVGWRPGDRGAL